MVLSKRQIWPIIAFGVSYRLEALSTPQEGLWSLGRDNLQEIIITVNL